MTKTWQFRQPALPRAFPGEKHEIARAFCVKYDQNYGLRRIHPPPRRPLSDPKMINKIYISRQYLYVQCISFTGGGGVFAGFLELSWCWSPLSLLWEPRTNLQTGTVLQLTDIVLKIHKKWTEWRDGGTSYAFKVKENLKEHIFPVFQDSVEEGTTRGTRTTALVYLQLHSSLPYIQALYMYCPVLLEYIRLVWPPTRDVGRCPQEVDFLMN
jgi:hypothetical protein